jgi:hypothetical protein
VSVDLVQLRHSEVKDWEVILDNLQKLLEKQLGFAREGGFREVAMLAEQVDSVIGKISQAGVFEKPELKQRQEKLRGLYRELELAITAEKTEVSGQLNHVRKGRRVMEVYKHNL